MKIQFTNNYFYLFSYNSTHFYETLSNFSLCLVFLLNLRGSRKMQGLKKWVTSPKSLKNTAMQYIYFSISHRHIYNKLCRYYYEPKRITFYIPNFTTCQFKIQMNSLLGIIRTGFNGRIRGICDLPQISKFRRPQKL